MQNVEEKKAVRNSETTNMKKKTGKQTYSHMHCHRKSGPASKLAIVGAPGGSWDSQVHAPARESASVCVIVTSQSGPRDSTTHSEKGNIYSFQTTGLLLLGLDLGGFRSSEPTPKPFNSPPSSSSSSC